MRVLISEYMGIVKFLGGLLLLVTAGSVSATIIADQIDTPADTSSAPIGGTYGSASINVFLDPANTTWMALSRGSDLRTNLPNLSGTPTIQSTQMDDAILLTASIGDNSSSQIILDDNDSLNRSLGNQAVFYGEFNSVGSFCDGQVSGIDGYCGQAETGSLTSFFDTHGAGTYSLSLQYLNKYSTTAGHGNVFLLREGEITAGVPEPLTLVLLGTGLIILAGQRQRLRSPRS